MSFSFTVKAPTKHKAMVRAEMAYADVVRTQPTHERDRAAVFATIKAYLDLLHDDPTHDISLSVHGSLMWMHDGKYTSASVGVSAWHITKASENA